VQIDQVEKGGTRTSYQPKGKEKKKEGGRGRGSERQEDGEKVAGLNRRELKQHYFEPR
jgi:hypothetical protein